MEGYIIVGTREGESTRAGKDRCKIQSFLSCRWKNIREYLVDIKEGTKIDTCLGINDEGNTTDERKGGPLNLKNHRQAGRRIVRRNLVRKERGKEPQEREQSKERLAGGKRIEVQRSLWPK